MVAIQQEGEGAGGGVSTGGSRGSDRLPPPRAGEGWGWGRVMSVQLMGCRLWAAPIPAFPRKRGRGRWWRFNKRGRGGRWRFNRRQQGRRPAPSPACGGGLGWGRVAVVRQMGC